MSPTAPHASLDSMGRSVALAIGRHLDLGFRALAKGTKVTHDAAYLRVHSGEPHPLGNLAVVSAPASLASTRAAVEPLAATAIPSAVVFPELRAPADVVAFLVDQGYAAAGGLPAMAVDIARLKATTLPPGYEFGRVDRGPESEEWVRQFALGYELPVGVAQCFSPDSNRTIDATDDPVQYFVVRRQGLIVSTSVCCLQDGLAGIYCVSTIPAERHKGLGEHVTAEPLRRAAKLGYRVGVLQSSEAGYGVYQKLGFADFGSVPLYIRMPA
jgi:ribosomal protein S18 acetylase RimI-like enzyme